MFTKVNGCVITALYHRYTTLNRDWKRITRANVFLYKKRKSVETMHGFA